MGTAAGGVHLRRGDVAPLLALRQRCQTLLGHAARASQMARESRYACALFRIPFWGLSVNIGPTRRKPQRIDKHPGCSFRCSGATSCFQSGAQDTPRRPTNPQNLQQLAKYPITAVLGARHIDLGDTLDVHHAVGGVALHLEACRPGPCRARPRSGTAAGPRGASRARRACYTEARARAQRERDHA